MTWGLNLTKDDLEARFLQPVELSGVPAARFDHCAKIGGLKKRK